MPTVVCKTTKSDDVESLCCTALTFSVFQELELRPGSQLFLATSNLSVSLEPSCTKGTQSLVFANRCGWYIQRVLICKNSVPAENGQYKRLDDISVDDITGFYCIVLEPFHCSGCFVRLVGELRLDGAQRRRWRTSWPDHPRKNVLVGCGG